MKIKDKVDGFAQTSDPVQHFAKKQIFILEKAAETILTIISPQGAWYIQSTNQITEENLHIHFRVAHTIVDG